MKYLVIIMLIAEFLMIATMAKADDGTDPWANQPWVHEQAQEQMLNVGPRPAYNPEPMQVVQPVYIYQPQPIVVPNNDFGTGY